jgi:hypothetical protein
MEDRKRKRADDLQEPITPLSSPLSPPSSPQKNGAPKPKLQKTMADEEVAQLIVQSQPKTKPNFQYLVEIYGDDSEVYCSATSEEELDRFLDDIEELVFIVDATEHYIEIDQKGVTKHATITATGQLKFHQIIDAVSLAARRQGWKLVAAMSESNHHPVMDDTICYIYSLENS